MLYRNEQLLQGTNGLVKIYISTTSVHCQVYTTMKNILLHIAHILLLF